MIATGPKKPEVLHPDDIRVALVDDSSLVRGLFSRWLSEAQNIRVVGVHRDGLEATRQAVDIRPDVIVLDLEMPEMDGLTALPLLLEAVPGVAILVVSSLTLRGADITLRCLIRGAHDYMAKPSSLGGQNSTEFRAELVRKVRTLGESVRLKRQIREAGALFPPNVRQIANQSELTKPGLKAAVGEASRRNEATGASSKVELLVVGASTGGPHATIRLLKEMTPGLPMIPVVIAQHMPPMFTALFANHLRHHLGLDAREVGENEVLRPGQIYLVKGGLSLRVMRENDRFVTRSAALSAPVRLHPSVDLLFRSAADAGGKGVIGVVLTGMGEDGAQGARDISQAGGLVFAQDEATSVVWGMPGAVFRSGVCAGALPVEEIAQEIMKLCSG